MRHIDSVHKIQGHFENALHLAKENCDNEMTIDCLLSLYASHVRLGDAFLSAQCSFEAAEQLHSKADNGSMERLASQLESLEQTYADGVGLQKSSLCLRLGDCYSSADPVLAVDYYQVRQNLDTILHWREG